MPRVTARGRDSTMLGRGLVCLILVGSATSCEGNDFFLEFENLPSFLIYGMVSSAGQTIPGTRVEISASLGPCAAGPPNAVWAVTTDANGWYERSVMTLTGRYSGCIEATATPPAETGLPPLTRREDREFSVAAKGTVTRFDLIYPD
jgi:hypothetical protein